MKCLGKLAALSLVGSTCFASAQGWTGDVFTLPTTATTITFKQGLGQLVVQAGTVATPSPIFLGPSPLAPELPTMVPGSIVAIGRPLLKLLKPVTLKLAYDPGNLPANTAAGSLRIFKLSNHKWVALTSTVDTINKVVSATISQPATYALISNAPAVAMANDLLVYEYEDWNPLIAGTYVSNGFHDAFSSLDLNFLPDTVVRRPVGRAIEREALPTISPAYNAIFYSKWQPNGYREAFIANADGSHPQRITNLGAKLFGEGAIQGDGRAGVFAAYVGSQWNVYRMNADGTGVASIVSNVATTLALGPPVAINPSGTQAVVGNGAQVMVLTVATGALVRSFAIPGATKVVGLAYHPNGTTVAITADNGLYTATANSGSPLKRDGAEYFDRPTYSPDGTQIAVVYGTGINILTVASNTWASDLIPKAPTNVKRRFRLAWR